MAKSLAEAKTAAMKVLGDKAKIPDPKVNFAKVRSDFDKSGKEYDDAVSVLQTKILAFQNGNSSLKNSIQQYEDQISKADFGLDKKDDEDKKKIKQAQKVISDFLDSAIANCDTNIKNLGALDKHTMAISEYENECSS
jgi:hypothetical protein